jgi:hypothetical protein
MLTLLLDILGAYWVTRKTKKYSYFVLWSLIIGVVNSFGTNYLLYSMNSKVFSTEATALGAVFGVFIHPIICFLLMLIFRSRQKNRDIQNDIEIAEATNTEIHDDNTGKRIFKPIDKSNIHKKKNSGLIPILIIIGIPLLVYVLDNNPEILNTLSNGFNSLFSREKVLDYDHRKKINGKGGVYSSNYSDYFKANIYNGNEDIRLTSIQVKITTMMKNIKEERVYIDYVIIDPLSKGEMRIEILPFDEDRQKMFSLGLLKKLPESL